MSKIIGIDPGTKSCGFAVLDNGKLLSVKLIKASGDITKRLKNIYHSYCCEISALEDVEAIAIEDGFVGKYAKAAMRLGEARGILYAAAADFQLPVFTYEPKLVKRAVAAGSSSKQQVKQMIYAICDPGRELADDESDAIAVALCHLHRCQY